MIRALAVLLIVCSFCVGVMVGDSLELRHMQITALQPGDCPQLTRAAHYVDTFIDGGIGHGGMTMNRYWVCEPVK